MSAPGLSPAPVPEGMETTAEERASWMRGGQATRHLSIDARRRLLRDFARQSAEIERLEATAREAAARADEWKRAADDLGRREATARAEEREAFRQILEGPMRNAMLDMAEDILKAVNERGTP